jgi:CheY-like chemotaxis protein
MSMRVMVVDDDPALRRMLSRVLARAGFEVSTAADGAPAMALADIAMPDLAIVDFNMPTNGLEVVRHLKTKHNTRIYVAVLTGEEDAATLSACYAAGADAVLAKPIAPIELRRHLIDAAAALKSVA